MPVVVGRDLDLLTVVDVANLLRVSPRTVWRWVSVGLLPAPLRVGAKCTRWREAELRRHVEALRPIDRPA